MVGVCVESIRKHLQPCRLAEIAVHSSIEASFLLTIRNMCRECDYFQMAPVSLTPPYFCGRFVAVHARQLAVHQNQIVSALTNGPKRARRIADEVNSITQDTKLLLDQNLVGEVVFDHQDTNVLAPRELRTSDLYRANGIAVAVNVVREKFVQGVEQQ